MYHNFAKYCLTHGSIIRPLNIPLDGDEYVGICNPSILVDDDRIRLILRKVNYALWSCDDQYKFTTQYGPLWYITPDNDNRLKTKNCLCELTDENLDYKPIDTSNFDTEPLWEFVGLEDARLVRWDGKLYATGVRRDTTTNGQGRMELSELDENGKEISRVRIKAPGNDDSYCEKNWMPILDMPFHYVKWCNPVEVVKVNPVTGDCEIVVSKEQPSTLKYYSTDNMDIRGSSQVIRWGDYRVAITHMCTLWMNEKNQKCGTGYYEQFIVWDKDWNIIKLSEPFTFAHFGVEFTTGMAHKDGKFYIPFALQDNFSFMLEVDEHTIHRFIFNENYEYGVYVLKGNELLDFFNDTQDSKHCMELGMTYYNDGYYAPAMVLFERACEYNTFRLNSEMYNCLYLCGKSIANIGGRDEAELGLWYKMINFDMHRSEGYLMLSRYYEYRGHYCEAYAFAKIAYELNNYGLEFINDLDLTSFDGDFQYIKMLYYTENYLDCLPWLEEMKGKYKLNQYQLENVNGLIDWIKNNDKNKYRVL